MYWSKNLKNANGSQGGEQACRAGEGSSTKEQRSCLALALQKEEERFSACGWGGWQVLLCPFGEPLRGGVFGACSPGLLLCSGEPGRGG